MTASCSDKRYDLVIRNGTVVDGTGAEPFGAGVAAGLLDRGVIRAGKKADINVIDYTRLRFGKPYVT
jgi:N-acyl-D-aspartate/D-glutamate deacylase